MFYLRFAGLSGKSWSRNRTRRTRVTKHFTRRLGFLCLEDRRLLASILGTAESFAVLGASTVTNTGPTVITGDVGVFPGPSITGFAIPPANTVVEGPGSTGLVAGPGLVTGTIYISHAVAQQAQVDNTTAYNGLKGMPFTSNLTGQDLGNLTLSPGVYRFASSAQLTGTLTLDAEGNNNAFWVFQIGSTLTTASASSVVVVNSGPNGGDDVGVFWQVGSSATLGTSTAFLGNILALESITLNTTASIPCGRALAQTGAVTLDTNVIRNVCADSDSGYSGGLEFDDNGDLAPIFRYSIAWEKRDAAGLLLGGAQFTITPDPTDGVGILTILDNGPGDANPALGQVLVNNAMQGTYTVTETVAPLGYTIDAVATRSIIVSGLNLNAVIGVQGTDDPGVTDESDFHNSLILVAVGNIAWEKRDAAGLLLGGVQFTISPNPITGIGLLTVLDNGPGDADPGVGQILVNNSLPGTYTVTETVAPPGYVTDADATRMVTVTVNALTQVIGVQGTDDPGVTDESDFHNSLILVAVGSIAWEKRDAAGLLLGGAQFTISPDPLDGVGILTILDNGPGDADPALGQILVINALPGTYTVTETVAPLGFVIDADPTRVVTVTVGNLTQVIGVQGFNDVGVTDESDFHNSLIQVAVGSIAWEKRDAAGLLLGGVQFTITPNPITGVGLLTILDNGPGDADPALGQILVINALPGTYTVTETVAPLGFVIDADPTRVVTVTVGNLTQVIGVQGFNDVGVTDESDFHNSLILVAVGSIAWEKRDAAGLLLGGAQFTISPDPLDGAGILTILDNGPGDADPALGQILVINALPGTYTVTETVAPLGYIIDADPTRVVTVTVGNLTQVIGVQGFNDVGVTDESDFHNRKRNVIVIGPGKSPNTPQFVRVLDQESGDVLAQFAPYGNTFQGGVRVATGDLTGDGIDEIVTAPGWSMIADVRVYTQSGVLLTSFRPYGSGFDGGVQVAVGDVDGDGVNDIITVPSYGPAEVKVFRNLLVGVTPTFSATAPFRSFLAFPASFFGGAVVATADMGSLVGSSFVNTLDGKAEIVVGSGAGVQTTVKVFDVSGTPTLVRSFTPFSTATTIDNGGVSLSVARINADLIPDIAVGAGVNGNSLVDVWAWSNTSSATLSSLSANGVGFAAFTDASRNAPVEVATQDTNGDDISDVILAVQGPGGTTNEIRAFTITSVSPLQVSSATAVAGSYLGPFYIASIANPLPVQPLLFGLSENSQVFSSAIHNDSTKFFVVNDATTNRTYEYAASGTAEENYVLSSGNSAPRGAVSTAVGDQVWVVDANRKVYVYNSSGSVLGSWTARTLAKNAVVEGIATNGNDIWIVDAKSDKVFKYTNAASRLSGAQNAVSSFKLNRGNTGPKDIVTDGTSLWVVNDAAQDKVFKYTLSGLLVGSWTIIGGGGAPTGITLDPAAPNDLWIVDRNSDRVYQYDSAVGRTSGSLGASISFALAAGNTNPQGIADPPPTTGSATKAVTQDTALLSLMGEWDW